MKNKLIVFEGIDGVGKTTLAKETIKMLRKAGIEAVLYESVENKTVGFNKIKSFIKQGPIEASHLFYLASSVYKSSLIKQILQKSWVVCDRYVYSTNAHHWVKGSTLQTSNLDIIKPDFTFLIVSDEKIRAHRILQRRKITEDDLVPKIKGSLLYKKEAFLKKMHLTLIENSGLLGVSMQKIRNIMLSKTK